VRPVTHVNQKRSFPLEFMTFGTGLSTYIECFYRTVKGKGTNTELTFVGYRR